MPGRHTLIQNRTWIQTALASPAAVCNFRARSTSHLWRHDMTEQLTDKITKTETEWRQQLTPEQYQVARACGTEPAFTGQYWNKHDDGTYHCVCCGALLFGSETKFDSGTGWPSVFAAADPKNIIELTDNSYAMTPTEPPSSPRHTPFLPLSPDVPAPTGLRYCMNSASLDFKPKK